MKEIMTGRAAFIRRLLHSKISLLFFFAGGLFLLLFFLQSWLYPGLLLEEHFINHDAGHYYWIKTKGYEDYQVAFFPLFPLIWKLLSVPVYGIVCMNGLLYLTSFYFLARALSLNRAEVLFYLCIPSSLFLFLPFSESCFYAASVLLIIGVKTKRLILVLIALYVCTLARPAYTVLIPALVLMEVLTEGIRKKELLLKIGAYILVSVIGTIAVACIQFCYTGKWFKFFTAQRLWGNYLQLPVFPLRTWGGDVIVRLDGVALLFGLVSGIILLLYLFRTGPFGKLKIPREVVLSLAYLGGMALTVLLFRGGSLFSLNRFVFAVPFIVVALDFYLKQQLVLPVKQLFWMFVLIFLYWLCFGSYVHIATALKFFALSVYLSLFLLLKSGSLQIAKWAFWILAGLNFLFLVLFFVRFLLTKGEVGWVG
ncbi:MAG: hypothetical protein ACO1O6_14225 [Bacteroidota bacterium]